jgi:hypothetical protein
MATWFQSLLSQLPGSVTALGSQILIAVLSAFITVRWLSVSAFASQRWWERKATAYSDAVKVLAGELAEIGRAIDLEERGRTRAPSDEEVAQATNLRRRVQELAAAGAFEISPEAAQSLNTLQRELDKANAADTVYEQLLSEYEAFNKCLKRFTKCAHKDLRIRHWWNR